MFFFHVKLREVLSPFERSEYGVHMLTASSCGQDVAQPHCAIPDPRHTHQNEDGCWIYFSRDGDCEWEHLEQDRDENLGDP